MRKTHSPDEKATPAAPLNDLVIRPNETDQQAYDRIRLALCSAIDRFGTSVVRPHITTQAQRPKGNLIVNAYLSACLRRNVVVHGQECEIQLLMLPFTMQHADPRAVPTRVDSATCERIQRRLLEALVREGKKETLVIPADRLFSPLEFESEQPEAIHEALAHVALSVSSNMIGLLQSHVEYPPDDESASDDQFLYHDDIVTAPKLLPLFVLSPLGEAEPLAFSDEAVLSEISLILSLSPDETNSNRSSLVDAKQLGGTVRASTICNPFVAEKMICTEMIVTQLSLEILALTEQAEGPWSNTVIRYHDGAEHIHVQIYARDLNDEVNEYRLRYALRTGFSGKDIARQTFAKLFQSGLENLELISDPDDETILNLSRAIH
jgi:hypothetical protein